MEGCVSSLHMWKDVYSTGWAERLGLQDRKAQSCGVLESRRCEQTVGRRLVKKKRTKCAQGSWRQFSEGPGHQVWVRGLCAWTVRGDLENRSF